MFTADWFHEYTPYALYICNTNFSWLFFNKVGVSRFESDVDIKVVEIIYRVGAKVLSVYITNSRMRAHAGFIFRERNREDIFWLKALEDFHLRFVCVLHEPNENDIGENWVQGQ